MYCFDLETHQISAGNLAPKIVCAQVSDYGGDKSKATIYVDTPEFSLEAACKVVIEGTFITARGAFDLACICSNFPELIPAVFKALDEGRVHCVAIRDQLMMLAKHGYVDKRATPDGGSERLQYNLGAIAYRRLGENLKKGDDSWRLHFDVLEDIPLAEWPKEAVDYALEDVTVLDEIFADQEREAAEMQNDVFKHDVFKTEKLHVAADFSLYLMSCRGVRIDPVERARIEEWLEGELSPENLAPLFESGVLRKPVPALPHKRQMKKARELLSQEGLCSEGDPDWETADPSVVEWLKEQGIKFKPAENAKKNLAVLRDLILKVCAEHDIKVQYTDGGKSGNVQVSTAGEFLEEIEHLHPVLVAYMHRQNVEKILTTELPRMQADRIHANFAVLKETGRTSSFASNIYPSFNGQNVDPRVRGAYIPDEGWVQCSVDYSSIELCSLAQKQLDLFGRSTLAELFKQDVDAHAYLGAQMAYEMDLEGFNNALEAAGLAERPNGHARHNYDCFIDLKSVPYFKHWRTFAKPVGLGYPGGLGPDTMVTLAKSTYGVILSRDEAAQFRDLWHRTFPEMAEYFAWISQDCSLPDDTYWYISPMGMLRVGASYCAAANGAALQTPTSEGAKLGFWNVSRACYDETQESILYGCRPWNFVHDEILVDIPEDDQMHERAWEISKLMVSGMSNIIRDVPVKAEPALMRRWNKYAEYVEVDGRISVWEPEPEPKS